MKIASIRLAPGAALAPMAGFPDAAWRDISRGCQGLLSALREELPR